LRIVGYGFTPKAIIQCQGDGRDAFCDNVRFGWQFFPRNIARESEPFIFPAVEAGRYVSNFYPGCFDGTGYAGTGVWFWADFAQNVAQSLSGGKR